MQKVRYILTSLFIGLTLFASADTKLIPEMKFRRLDTQNGLSSSQVNCVMSDSRGYLWVGTRYGLNRYDGYRFKTFYSNIRDTTSMRDNYTDQIFEAYNGKLWLKQGMNYCVYDPVTETFERNAQRELEKFGISGGIENIYIDGKKNFWVKIYDKGLFFYNPKTKKKHLFKQGYEEGELKPTYGISNYADFEDKVVFSTNNGELVCLDGERGNIYWENHVMRDMGGPENQDYKLRIDKEGNFWCVALDFSFVYIKSENRWYSTITEYLRSHGMEGIPDYLQVWDTYVDDKGWIWFICDHEGLFVVDVKSGQVKQFKNSKFDETSISDNTPRNLYQDPKGRMWIGTFKNGLNEYVEGLSSLRNVEVGDINTVCEDRYGNYWLGSNDRGILVYDPKTGEVVANYTAENSGMSGNIVVGSWPASDGTIWFGSYNGGLSHCIPSGGNPAQATVINYRATGQADGLANNSVWALTEDKWHRIWFTTLGGGLQMLNPQTGKFHTWNTQNSKLPSDYLTSVEWTKKGWLLVGTSYYYSLANPSSLKLVSQVLPEDPNITVNISSTSYILEDSRGLIWQGSSSGLTVYDPKSKFMDMIDMTDGLFGSSINSIAEDKRHSIWAVTDHGVSNIVPLQQEDGTWQFNIRSFNSRDGLQKATYNQRSTWITHDGLLLVGGQGGLDIINPAQLQEKQSKEHPVFSGLQIFDQDVAPGKKFDGRVILDEALDICREITLRFNDQFTIQLATSEVDVNNHKRFGYKLEGFNENWVKTSELNPNITYNSLRAGSYILCVRILNEDGSLGKEESRLSITIRPPLWRTRWMVLLYMVLIALAALAWGWFFKKKQHEKMELERLRRETEKKQWMSEMRKQLMAEMQMTTAANPQSAALADGDIVIPQKMNINIVPLFREVCDKFRPADGKSIRLSFFPFVDDLVMMADKNHLREMLQILLNNAANFSPNNSKVKVFVEKQDDNAILRVADSGVGIPDEAMPNLFDEIIGDDDTPNLHKVFEIVMEHHGTIAANENHGGGTVFTISFPLEDPEVEEAVLMED